MDDAVWRRLDFRYIGEGDKDDILADFDDYGCGLHEEGAVCDTRNRPFQQAHGTPWLINARSVYRRESVARNRIGKKLLIGDAWRRGTVCG